MRGADDKGDGTVLMIFAKRSTLALRAGIHAKVVSERLWRATIAITLDPCPHAIPAMQEEAAALVARLVVAAKQKA